MFSKLVHENRDFGQGHGRTARDLDQNVLGICQHAATIHQWTFQRLIERVVSSIVRISLAISKQATPVRAAQCGEQIVKSDPDNAWPLNQVNDRPNALADGDVGHGERLMNTSLRCHEIAHPIIFKADDRVRDSVQSAKSFLRLNRSSLAFEAKW